MEITINGYRYTLDNFVAGQYMLIDDMLAVTGKVSLERIENVATVHKILNNDFSSSLFANAANFSYHLEYLDYLLATPLVMKRFYEMVMDRLDMTSIRLGVTDKVHRLNIMRLMYPTSVRVHVVFDYDKSVVDQSQGVCDYHLKIDGTQRKKPTNNLNELFEQLADYLFIFTSIKPLNKIEITYIGPEDSPSNRIPHQLHCPVLMESGECMTIANGHFDLTQYVVSYLDRILSY
jgi:hypothetical protein